MSQRGSRAITATAELAAALPIAGGAVAAIFGMGLLNRFTRSPRARLGLDGKAPHLLTLEADYTLNVIKDRQLEQGVIARDLDGFFGHVWSAHPAAGANPEQEPRHSTGPPAEIQLAPRHTVIEARAGLLPSLRLLPLVNFTLAQSALLLRLARLMRSTPVAVVRASDPFYLGLFGLLLARAGGVPLVIRLIANYDSGFYADGKPVYPRLFRRRWVEKRVDRYVLSRADLVAAGNQDLVKYALANGAREGRTTVFRVGNVVDTVHYDLEPDQRPSVRTELGLGGRPFLILVSRLVAVKHPEDLLAVLAEARKAVPELAGVIVGDGDMRPELDAMAERLGLSEHLVFVRQQTQPWIASAMTSAAVVLSPLTGRALIEAALSGTPIVAYDVDWHSELVRPGETGVLVPYRDTSAMAQAVCRLISDPSYAERLATAARRKALELMHPKTLIRHERQQYERLLAGGPYEALTPVLEGSAQWSEP